MSSLEHPAVAKVAAALAEAGQHAAAEGIRVLPAEVRTAAQAAEALGVPVGAIANSLTFRLGSDKIALLALPAGTAEQRAPMWLTHALREGWRCMAAFDADDILLGLAYGYRGRAGQWWHEQVRHGLSRRSGSAEADRWLSDYFELTEIHVRPE